MNNSLAVGFATEDQLEQARRLAEQLDVSLDNQILPRLCVTQDKLVLFVAEFSPLFVDFNSWVWKKRREAGKKQGIIRACKPAKSMRIVDLTAGWGRDAAILASFGAEVVMIERNPIMAALLADGLARLDVLSPLAGLLSLQCLDSKNYLQNLSQTDYPDVIYIDPMHPERQKSALVKKDMQALQYLLGTEDDAKELIQLAIGRATQRVVVKWPQRLPALVRPHMSIEGKTVRFDVYMRQ